MRTPPATLLGIALVLMAARTPPAAAQQENGSGPSTSGFYAVPFVIYSPETSWIFGVGGAGFSRASADTALKPSTYAASIQYSINGQYVFNPSAQLYFDEGRTLLEARVELVRSFEVYYGVGNEAPELDDPEYEMRRIQVRAEYLRQIGRVLAGPVGEFSDEKLRDARNNPFLRAESAPGQAITREIGAGGTVLYDTRDRVYSSASGSLARLRIVGYPEWLGSEVGFTWIETDLRHYSSIGEDQVIAVQLYAEATGGNVPFFRLPALGGDERMRGFLRGRYRDRVSVTVQTEFRTGLFWRIGAVLFASLGEVSPSVGGMALNRFRHAAGAGLRYTVDETEKLKIRVDYGVGPGTSGFYLTVDEAF